MLHAMFVTKSAGDLAAALEQGHTVVDVRERHEYVAGHVAGAEWIPLSIVPLRMDDFRRPNTWVICQSGGRSAQAATFLAQRGIEVTNVNGGMNAWRMAGLPVVAGE